MIFRCFHLLFLAYMLVTNYGITKIFPMRRYYEFLYQTVYKNYDYYVIMLYLQFVVCEIVYICKASQDNLNLQRSVWGEEYFDYFPIPKRYVLLRRYLKTDITPVIRSMHASVCMQDLRTQLTYLCGLFFAYCIAFFSSYLVRAGFCSFKVGLFWHVFRAVGVSACLWFAPVEREAVYNQAFSLLIISVIFREDARKRVSNNLREWWRASRVWKSLSCVPSVSYLVWMFFPLDEQLMRVSIA